ncbi:MAG TPA: hypothetical protein VMG58_04570, partial [Candidatus Sulfotelmatobacter sp.]|nr:hypothetical protein [Candidatus Sulfotelmatobacter sp.]
RSVWSRTWKHLREGRLWSLRPDQLTMAAGKEVVLFAMFAMQMVSSFQANTNPAAGSGESAFARRAA